MSYSSILLKRKEIENYGQGSGFSSKDGVVCHQLIAELLLEDKQHFENYFRIGKEQFCFIVNSVSFKIKKQDTKLRENIKPNEELR